MIAGSKRRNTFYVLLFLLPNLLGFALFTAGPVVGSFAMSLTDLSLTEHNAFSDTNTQFVGTENYERILVGSESERFWRYFGNTLFLMIGVPLGIAGSLAVSLLVTAKIPPASTRNKTRLAVATACVAVATAAVVGITTWPGAPPAEPVLSAEAGLTDMPAHDVERLRSLAAVVATLAVGALAVLGLTLGSQFFRTAFYLPSLLAGVPTFLLWKALYRPDGGLINTALDPAIDTLHTAVSSTPAPLWRAAGLATLLATAALVARLLWVGALRLVRRDTGPAAFGARLLITATLAITGIAIASVLHGLPEQAALAADAGIDGFEPPEWLVSSTWAKPALVIMGVWLGVGGANMLLYIAGISNIPPELYEAADIDGAGHWQRFINITWPQLAPTTFFIVIMSTIAGLQGGFEQALIMTGGNYDTTVLTYYIYNLAFTDNFELGLASAVAWIMFAMIFGMTLVNYRLGSRLTNE